MLAARIQDGNLLCSNKSSYKVQTFHLANNSNKLSEYNKWLYLLTVKNMISGGLNGYSEGNRIRP